MIKEFRKGEIVFNILSLVAMILIGLYFGGRSFYYYSKQNNKRGDDNFKLALLVKNNNKVVKGEDGFHYDDDGYYFKGNVSNNYVKFSNRLFRIIRVNNDDTVKLVSDDIVSTFMYGDDYNYQNSNLDNFLNKNENIGSGIYYDTFNNLSNYLVKTDYAEDIFSNNKLKKSNKKYSDLITSLEVNDFILAGGNKSYLNINKNFWLIGNTNDQKNLYVDNDGVLNTADSYEAYGVRSVITLDSNNLVVSGTGSLLDPYVVKCDDSTLVNTYVRLGNDLYKVYGENDGILYLVLNGYVTINNQEVMMAYSNSNSLFDVSDKKSLANYLNTSYINSLDYKDLLLDSVYYLGEISNDTSYSLLNIYTNSVNVKVGLLNVFSYNPVNTLSDYYFLNTTSSVGSMEYIYNHIGFLEEDRVDSLRHIVPTIAINKSVITNGEGLIDNPYVVE